MFFYGELDTYIIPSLTDIVTLGGSRSFDNELLEGCPYDYAAIHKRCSSLVPSVRSAKIVKKDIGLRPHRDGGVRLEGSSTTNGSAKTIVSNFIRRDLKDSRKRDKLKIALLCFLQIIHNYGHGGYGVCMAPGTAIAAVNTAIQLHKRSNIISKL